MNLGAKSENVIFFLFLILGYMQKIRKFYRADIRESSETDRQRRT